MAKAGVTAAGRRRHRHHQPARDHASLWDRATGKPIHNAIVWQDRRTADACAGLRDAGHETAITDKTGLVLDPYFSASKIAWLLDNVDGAREAAEAGRLAFGTVDTFLLWRLTGGRVHATDATNASRTLLFDIAFVERGTRTWRSLFRSSHRRCCRRCGTAPADFGETLPDLFGGPIRILGIAGDQQAATIGQGCFQPGMMKSTYGTGCFALLNTGRHTGAIAPSPAHDDRLSARGQAHLCARGRNLRCRRRGAMAAGRACISSRRRPTSTRWRERPTPPSRSTSCRRSSASARRIGMPRRAARILGLTRNTGPGDIARAALEAVGYQTRDMLEAMHADWPGAADTVLRVDGGMTASEVTMQFLADILGAPVDRPVVMETTALGAAFLAGYRAGVCPAPEGFAATWQLDRRFKPAMDDATRTRKWAGWQDAIARVRTPLRS